MRYFVLTVYTENDCHSIKIHWQWAMSLLHYAKKLGFYYLDVTVEKWLESPLGSDYDKLLAQYYISQNGTLQKVIFGE